MESLESQLPEAGDRIEGDLSSRHGVLRIREARRQFWSPNLDLTIKEDDEGEDAEAGFAKLWGTFSPRPEIWTGIVFSIGTLIVLSLFASIYGIAQLLLGQLPWALLIPAFGVLLAALIYTSALVGQGLSIGDMYAMRAFVDECVRKAEARASYRPRTARESAQL